MIKLVRAKSARFTTRKLDESELLASFDQSLTTLVQLVGVYDGGYAPIALAMATEVHKILTENNAAVKLRGSRVFTTVAYEGEGRMLNAMHKLTVARVCGNPPQLDFVPAFYSGPPASSTLRLKFSDWWNKDAIYRASAALPGTAPGLIPVNGSPTVPFAKRESINRRDFVSLLRNKLGAHQAADMPNLLDELNESRSWGDFAVDTDSGLKSTHDGSLTTGTGIMAAMMRQITHEVLVAYGREDNGPSAPATP